MRYMGIDVGKRRCVAVVKDECGSSLQEIRFLNSGDGVRQLLDAVKPEGDLVAVVEATCNAWVKIYDALMDNGVHVKLANPSKTRAIAEARIKSDRADASILADLLRGDLVAESYVPSKERRGQRALVRHRAALIKERTEVKNRIHSLLEKYDVDETLFSDLFSKCGREWLSKIKLSDTDRFILEGELMLLKSLEEQVDRVTRRIASEAYDEDDVKLLMTMPGIDFYSALLIISEIGSIDRFRDQWKLVSYAGLAPSLHQSGNTLYTGRITKRGSKWLRWILVQCAQTARLHDERLKRYYERVASKKGHQKAIVAVAKEMLCIIWFMLKRKEPYRGENKNLTNRKLIRMHRLAQEG